MRREEAWCQRILPRADSSVISRMPKLQTVQIGNLAPRPRDDFVRDGLAALIAFETNSAKLESEALKATGWAETLGSSETAAAATAVVSASAHSVVEWKSRMRWPLISQVTSYSFSQEHEDVLD